MPKYVAFLRAINVGGHTVKMDQLRKLFEAIGFSNVETFIASGNVIFDAQSKNTQSLEEKIAAHLRKSLGYDVVTFVRTLAELSEVGAYKPASIANVDTEKQNVYVGFASENPSAATTKKLRALSSETDAFSIRGREVYWVRSGGFSDSEFSAAQLEKLLAVPLTFRNINTVRRLAAKYCRQ
jgi:uncharacterized protein (DUF1697 family)